MAMRTNSVRSIMSANQEAFRGMTASAIMEKLNNEFGMGLGSLGQIPAVMKELGLTAASADKPKTSNTVKVHFNGYSNNLSAEFRRAYNSYAETDSSAPNLADNFSQVTQDAKDFIAAIAENPLFKAFLNASNCREPSKDFALLGVKTAAMIAEELEEQRRNAEEIARKTECLEKSGYLVLSIEGKQTFKLADEAISANAQIAIDYKAYSANVAEIGKIKDGIEGLEKNLSKAATEVAKETLTAKIADERIELGKLEAKVATQGQALLGLANRAKRFADMALIRHAQLVKVIDGLVEASDAATKLAETAGIESLASVQDLIKSIEKTAPETLDPRAVKLVEKGRCKSIEEAMQFLKDME